MWFDAQDPATLFADVGGTQPLVAQDGAVVARWNSKGSLPGFAMTTGSGTATYRAALLKGGSLAALTFRPGRTRVRPCARRLCIGAPSPTPM